MSENVHKYLHEYFTDLKNIGKDLSYSLGYENNIGLASASAEAIKKINGSGNSGLYTALNAIEKQEKMQPNGNILITDAIPKSKVKNFIVDGNYYITKLVNDAYVPATIGSQTPLSPIYYRGLSRVEFTLNGENYLKELTNDVCKLNNDLYDTLDLCSGIKLKRIDKYEITGSENWYLHSHDNTYTTFMCNEILIKSVLNTNEFLCSHFNNTGDADKIYYEENGSDGGYWYFKILNTTYGDATSDARRILKFKEWLSGLDYNVTIYYKNNSVKQSKINNPLFIELTDNNSFVSLTDSDITIAYGKTNENLSVTDINTDNLLDNDEVVSDTYLYNLDETSAFEPINNPDLTLYHDIENYEDNIQLRDIVLKKFNDTDTPIEKFSGLMINDSNLITNSFPLFFQLSFDDRNEELFTFEHLKFVNNIALLDLNKLCQSIYTQYTPTIPDITDKITIDSDGRLKSTMLLDSNGITMYLDEKGYTYFDGVLVNVEGSSFSEGIYFFDLFPPKYGDSENLSKHYINFNALFNMFMDESSVIEQIISTKGRLTFSFDNNLFMVKKIELTSDVMDDVKLIDKRVTFDTSDLNNFYIYVVVMDVKENQVFSNKKINFALSVNDDYELNDNNSTTFYPSNAFKQLLIDEVGLVFENCKTIDDMLDDNNLTLSLNGVKRYNLTTFNMSYKYTNRSIFINKLPEIIEEQIDFKNRYTNTITIGVDETIDMFTYHEPGIYIVKGNILNGPCIDYKDNTSHSLINVYHDLKCPGGILMTVTEYPVQNGSGNDIILDVDTSQYLMDGKITLEFSNFKYVLDHLIIFANANTGVKQVFTYSGVDLYEWKLYNVNDIKAINVKENNKYLTLVEDKDSIPFNGYYGSYLLDTTGLDSNMENLKTHELYNINAIETFNDDEVLSIDNNGKFAVNKLIPEADNFEYSVMDNFIFQNHQDFQICNTNKTNVLRVDGIFYRYLGNTVYITEDFKSFDTATFNFMNVVSNNDIDKFKVCMESSNYACCILTKDTDRFLFIIAQTDSFYEEAVTYNRYFVTFVPINATIDYYIPLITIDGNKLPSAFNIDSFYNDLRTYGKSNNFNVFNLNNGYDFSYNYDNDSGPAYLDFVNNFKIAYIDGNEFKLFNMYDKSSSTFANVENITIPTGYAIGDQYINNYFNEIYSSTSGGFLEIGFKIMPSTFKTTTRFTHESVNDNNFKFFRAVFNLYYNTGRNIDLNEAPTVSDNFYTKRSVRSIADYPDSFTDVMKFIEMKNTMTLSQHRKTRVYFSTDDLTSTSYSLKNYSYIETRYGSYTCDDDSITYSASYVIKYDYYNNFDSILSVKPIEFLVPYSCTSIAFDDSILILPTSSSNSIAYVYNKLLDKLIKLSDNAKSTKYYGNPINTNINLISIKNTVYGNNVVSTIKSDNDYFEEMSHKNFKLFNDVEADSVISVDNINYIYNSDFNVTDNSILKEIYCFDLILNHALYSDKTNTEKLTVKPNEASLLNPLYLYHGGSVCNFVFKNNIQSNEYTKNIECYIPEGFAIKDVDTSYNASYIKNINIDYKKDGNVTSFNLLNGCIENVYCKEFGMKELIPETEMNNIINKITTINYNNVAYLRFDVKLTTGEYEGINPNRYRFSRYFQTHDIYFNTLNSSYNNKSNAIFVQPSSSSVTIYLLKESIGAVSGDTNAQMIQKAKDALTSLYADGNEPITFKNVKITKLMSNEFISINSGSSFDKNKNYFISASANIENLPLSCIVNYDEKEMSKTLDINADSTNDEVPTAKAVYDLIQEALYVDSETTI